MECESVRYVSEAVMVISFIVAMVLIAYFMWRH